MEAEDRWLPLFAAVVEGPSDMVNSVQGVHGGIVGISGGPSVSPDMCRLVHARLISVKMSVQFGVEELVHGQASSCLPMDWRMQRAWHRIRDRHAPGHGT